MLFFDLDTYSREISGAFLSTDFSFSNAQKEPRERALMSCVYDIVLMLCSHEEEKEKL